MDEKQRIIFLFSFLLLIVSVCVSLAIKDEDTAGDDAKCHMPLGMQSMEIPDSALSASSSYDQFSVGPRSSRIRTEKYGGAWCPKQPISREVYEWIEIEFTQMTVITSVETQGRYGNGQGLEYAPMYYLEYQRNEEDRWWRRHRDRYRQELITGNRDTRTAEMRQLDPFIVAHRIRFVPFSHHPRTICMRIELYGCKWNVGVLSYKMRQGDTRGDGLDLSDFLYDGQHVGGILSDGLGQIVDGKEGHSNFRLDVSNSGKRGFEWIGWKSSGSQLDQVEILFQFNSIRNFTKIKVHSNNMFSKDVRVFRRAEVHFSIGGMYYDQHQQPIEVDYITDNSNENARYVDIEMPSDGRLGRFVKLVLLFDARWIMISEVKFQSEPINGSFVSETEPLPTSTVLQLQSPDWSIPPEVDQSNVKKQNAYEELTDKDDVADKIKGQDYIGWPQPSSDSPPTLDIEKDVDRALQKSYIAIIAGTTAAVVIVTVVVCICVALWYRRRIRCSGYSNRLRNSVFTVERFQLGRPNSVATMLDDGRASEKHLLSRKDSGQLKKNELRTSMIEEQKNVQELISEQLIRDLTDFDCHDEISQANRHSMNNNNNNQMDEDIEPLDMDSMVSIDGIGKWTLVSFPRHRLQIVEKLGEGVYSEIRLCELKRLKGIMTSSATEDCKGHSVNVTEDKMLVILKSLKHDASVQDRKDFEEEIKRMFNFNHPNIVRFFGICESTTSLEVVVEYSKYGTLHQFLQQRTTTSNTSDIATKYQPPFSHGYLIYIATEIASGMKYLESCNIAHRDLATRNCLVSDQMTIKLTDVASACHRYSNHYYHVNGGRAAMPIRWMAWESVLLRNFTIRSDVWAFGVTLWEILTCARTLPFDHLSNQQVIDNCCHYYHSDGIYQRLPQPTGCAREIYDLMVECWNKEADQRPTFKDIHMFLSRKNLGFNQLDEVHSGSGVDNPVITDVVGF